MPLPGFHYFGTICPEVLKAGGILVCTLTCNIWSTLLTSITVSDIFITVTVIRRQVLCETMRKVVRSQR